MVRKPCPDGLDLLATSSVWLGAPSNRWSPRGTRHRNLRRHKLPDPGPVTRISAPCVGRVLRRTPRVRTMQAPGTDSPCSNNIERALIPECPSTSPAPSSYSSFTAASSSAAGYRITLLSLAKVECHTSLFGRSTHRTLLWEGSTKLLWSEAGSVSATLVEDRGRKLWICISVLRE